MKFYDFPMAPSPRRARILLAEKNVSYETIIVDLAAEEQLSDDFRKINPACTIPVLQLDNGSVLTENNGIAAFLEAEYPEPPMLGETPLEKGLVAGWNTKIETEGLLAVAEAMRNSSPGMRDRALTGAENWQQIPQLAERGLARLKLFFDNLDTRLEGRSYVAIDSFSLADITAVVAVDFARIVKVKPLEHHENILRWRAALNERPSIAT